MWTTKNRGRYDRSKLRYPSDLTDDEWAHVEPLIPPVKRGGNRRHGEVREVMNGIMYVLSTGCQWRAIPHYGCMHRMKPQRNPGCPPVNTPAGSYRSNRFAMRHCAAPCGLSIRVFQRYPRFLQHARR